MIELTDEAVSKAIERTAGSSPSNIRVGVIPGGCAGWEYIITYADTTHKDDVLLDFGKFKIAVDELSIPYLEGSTLDWIQEGLNEYFKIVNPKEVSSCGCGVSVSFKV